MSVNYFTKEYIEKLQDNPYVKKISEKVITYTDEFNEKFYIRYSDGESPSKILVDMGFNQKVLK
ncbi:MAG: HTH domain-containing protein [Traorella sp.]